MWHLNHDIAGSDLQSDSPLDSIRNSCDVFILGKGSECALSSLKAQNSRVGPEKDEALYGCFNIKVKKGNPKWTWIYGHRFYPSINPCVGLWFLKLGFYRISTQCNLFFKKNTFKFSAHKFWCETCVLQALQVIMGFWKLGAGPMRIFLLSICLFRKMQINCLAHIWGL